VNNLIIVCDSSALVALALCNHLELLDKLYHTVYIPRAVYEESIVAEKPGASAIKTWSQGKIIDIHDENNAAGFLAQLDRGESYAMAIYLETQADTLLIDEKRGRNIAQSLNMNVTGSMGILLSAKKHGYIDYVKPSIDILKNSTIHISDKLFSLVLARAGE
jgi:predicted nucleic acid-binding protein